MSASLARHARCAAAPAEVSSRIERALVAGELELRHDVEQRVVEVKGHVRKSMAQFSRPTRTRYPDPEMAVYSVLVVKSPELWFNRDRLGGTAIRIGFIGPELLEDLASTCGTPVNGRKVWPGRVRLLPGDTIHIGRHLFVDDETDDVDLAEEPWAGPNPETNA